MLYIIILQFNKSSITLHFNNVKVYNYLDTTVKLEDLNFADYYGILYIE